jgi:hypothetical protein
MCRSRKSLTDPRHVRPINTGQSHGTGINPLQESRRHVGQDRAAAVACKVAATNAPIPKKWGSTQTVYLSDGLGQGNNIAVFDTWVQGICAQLDLWRTSPRYKNKRFEDAIRVWSGGNNVESYIAYVTARVPGMTETP